MKTMYLPAKGIAILLFALTMIGTNFCQSTPPIPQPDAANLTGLATPVEVEFSDGRILDGSGFFYAEFGPDDANAKGPHWRPVTHMYVITARHIIQPERFKDVVRFTYAMRIGKADEVEWKRFDLTNAELGKALHLCKKDEIDVAVIDITSAFSQLSKTPAPGLDWLGWNMISADEDPGKSPIQVQPGDDLVVIGYPEGFFDQFNKLPVLKTAL